MDCGTGANRARKRPQLKLRAGVLVMNPPLFSATLYWRQYLVLSPFDDNRFPSHSGTICYTGTPLLLATAVHTHLRT
jgi:hypothetical protein